jgi:hypothetical protein
MKSKAKKLPQYDRLVKILIDESFEFIDTEKHIL